MTKTNLIKEVLEKGVENIYPNKGALEKVLKSGKKIRLYCGYDPTAPSLHIGHAITLRKMAQFQKLGHEVIFLIGDFTAMIGDPTDKILTRKKLTRAQVNKNLKNYKKQASKILKFSGKNPAKVMFNSKWNDKLSFTDLINLASNFTAQQIIVRDMFRKRIKEDKLIFLSEFLYPLIQAHDSVVMDVDLEIGGNDQMFNMLRGRDLMRKLKNKEKFVLTTKLLVDSQGQKMGKTEGNIVNLDESPKEMYGQIMAWSDSLIFPGFELCTDLSLEEIIKIKEQKNNPRDDKARLAREIVSIHHGKAAAINAEKEFNRVFKEKKAPSKITVIKIAGKTGILNLIIKTKLAPSKSEAKRLIIQGAVKLDNVIIKDWQKKITPKKGVILRVGKRRFIKLS
jgi:tyrosyl-tRNA synthetase